MDPHDIHKKLYDANHVLKDPGNGGIIDFESQVSGGDLMICEMVSSGAETRTLRNPTKSGTRAILRMLTDGGDIVVSCTNGFNNAGENKATFNDASDLLNLISVKSVAGSPGTFRWQIMTRRIVFHA